MARNGNLRASDADRDAVVERLRRAAVEGRIDHAELDDRVRRALVARTYRELEATVADLPGPSRGAVRARRWPALARASAGVVRAHPALLVVAVPLVAATITIMMTFVMLWALVALAVLMAGRRPPRPPQPPHWPGQRRGRRAHWATF